MKRFQAPMLLMRLNNIHDCDFHPMQLQRMRENEAIQSKFIARHRTEADIALDCLPWFAYVSFMEDIFCETGIFSSLSVSRAIDAAQWDICDGNHPGTRIFQLK